MQYAQRQSGRSTWGEKVRFARGQAAAAMVRTYISESTNEALRRAAERKAPAQPRSHQQIAPIEASKTFLICGWGSTQQHSVR